MKQSKQSREPASKRKDSEKRKRSALLPPPPKLPEEVEYLFSINDFIELEYQRIEKLREHKAKTIEVCREIKEHDAIEKRIADASQELLREAHKAIDHGTSLLLKLIRSKKMLHVVLPTEKGKREGVKLYGWDESFECLASRIDFSNRQLIRLAESAVPKSRRKLFYQAKELTSAFLRLAQAFPDDFREAAESSLTMPSLRARTPAYSADAKAIAKSIHLAEKHPAANINDNRERLGALCHLLIAKFVEQVEWERQDYQNEKESFESLKVFKETAEEYSNISFEEWLKGNFYPTKLEGMLISSKLPCLKHSPEIWWNQRILPMVKEEFGRISKQPMRNAGIWQELKAKTRKDTPLAMRRLMEKNCHNKLHQIAKACP